MLDAALDGEATALQIEHFLFENALLTRKRQPPQRGVHSGENRVFRLNATFDFHKKSKVICSRRASRLAAFSDWRGYRCCWR
ncbi:hypothetical protein [Desulfovibrio sp. ZJ200]|uniref:hypothetical protein n=1 Tax=Desulfovibrio sp. ZJ200 TaxID=2709792 RepID=UPI0013E9C125|nr:hypothetical protein [Desulfovibrio sp. ZJ200]